MFLVKDMWIKDSKTISYTSCFSWKVLLNMEVKQKKLTEVGFDRDYFTNKSSHDDIFLGGLV